MKLTLATAAAILALTGCGPSATTTSSSPPPPANTATSPKVEKAVAVARDLENTSTSVDQVLQKHGLTEQQYEDLMYEIASDPTLSDQYSAKLGR